MDSRCTVHNMCGNGDHHVGAMDVDGQQVYSTHVAVMETIMWVPWMWMDSRYTVHNMCGNADHHVGAMDVDGQQVYSTHVR